MHVHRGGSVEAISPASGLVTAMEPVLRACAGTWIAHGAGDADRGTVDAHDRLGVPPDAPEYTLRVVSGSHHSKKNAITMASPTKASGHSATLRIPLVFRAEDWEAYRK